MEKIDAQGKQLELSEHKMNAESVKVKEFSELDICGHKT